MIKQLFLAALLGLPLLAPAQTTPVASRFYVGFGANILTGKPFHPSYQVYTGPALTAGFQFAPRLAVQVGAAYHSSDQNYTAYYLDSSLGPMISSTDITSKALSFPLLLRATLTRPTSRWRLDVLGGVLLQHGWSSYTNVQSSSSGQVLISQDEHTSTTGSLLLGPGVRYALRPQVDLVANTLVSLNLQRGYDFSNRLASNISAGVNVNFGH